MCIIYYNNYKNVYFGYIKGEAQLLSDRVLDSRPKGPEFEPHRRLCVVSLSKTQLSLLRTGSTQEHPS